MKRVVKQPEVRRVEIMQSAKKLFAKVGYANTSVEAIIRDAGIAKGTFYYYFKTKKEILNALVEQVREEMLEHFRSIVANRNLKAIPKLKLMLSGREKNVIARSQVMKVIHHPENRELQEQLNVQLIEQLAPLMMQVFEQGYAEDLFKSTPSLESIQLLLAASQFILDSGLFTWKPKKRALFLQTLQTMFEQTVGVKPGAFKFITKE